MQQLRTLLLVFMAFTESSFVINEVKQEFYQLVETICNRCEDDVTYDELQEQLWEYYQAPLALNQASKEVVQRLCILTEEQLDQLFEHLYKNGPFISIYELQAIPGFDLVTIQLLDHFVHIEEVAVDYNSRALWHQGLVAESSYVLMRYERTLETKCGYQRNKKHKQVPYVGSPDQLFTRLSIQHPSGWSIGVSASKGAGEALVWDPATQRYGLAPWRFHWLLKNKKRLKALVVGHYCVGYGQGLVLNAGFCMNKGMEAVKVIRTNNLGIRPHQSVSTVAFRGVATTWQWHPIECTTYYSNVDLHGKVKQDTSLSGPYVRSVTRGGNYKTRNELAQKGKINEQVIGNTLVYRGATQDVLLGINVLYIHYSLHIEPGTQSRRNPWYFRGQHHSNGSIFYRYLWQNLHFFGEGALSKGGGKAAIVGVVASLSRYVDATLLWRHYGHDFHSPYGKSFRENASSNSNERGMYLGVKATPLRHLVLDAYYDYFCFPKFFGSARAGYSWLAKAAYQLTRTSLTYIQYKKTTKPHRVANAQRVCAGTRQHYKLCWQYTISSAMRLKSEAQCSSYQHLKQQPTWGYAAVQEVAYKIRKLQLKGRVAWFNIKTPHNKLYFYEPNVLHTGFNFRSCQGKGMRYGLLVCYQPTSSLRCELKYTRTHYQDKNTIGSGQEAIQGNIKNDVTLQAILRF